MGTIAWETGVPEALRIRVGTAPVNWNNDDVADPATHLPCEDLLDAMAAAGYDGTEFGGNFPADPAAVRVALAQRGLALAGAYRWLPLTDDRAMSLEIPGLAAFTDRIAAAGATGLVVALSMTPERIALGGSVPQDGSASLDDAAWGRLAANLGAVAALARDRGLRTHFHNHVGSHVETPAELDRLVSLLPGTGADLCFDTGHYAFGGGDPDEFIARRAASIGYLHLKDVDPAVLDRARREKLGFLGAVREVVFSPFGAGMLDLPVIVERLREVRYDGWVIVEQDTCSSDPTEAARHNRGFLRERCGL